MKPTMNPTMKSRHPAAHSAVVAALLLVAAVPAGAAVITFSSYTATGATDTSWVLSDADLSANFGSTVAATYGGVSFLGGTFDGALIYDDNSTVLTAHLKHNVGFSLAYDGFYPGTGVLTTGTYQGDETYVVRFDNLTVGQDYTARFVVADNRDISVGNTITLQATGADTGSSDPVQYGYLTGEYAVVTATWTADSPVHDFAALNSEGGTQINAVQLKAIPEPALPTLLVSLLPLAARRRRRSRD